MTHMILELALWLLLAFFVGCVLGYLARQLFGSDAADEPYPVGVETVPEPVGEPIPPVPAEPIPTPAAVTLAAPIVVDSSDIVGEPVPLMAKGKPERPKGITEPREGKGDNLQRISGIGPKYERTLHNLGFYHFDQLAAWTDEHVDWVDDHLKFNGRIRREEWILQAILLADGKEEEFASKFGTGGMKTKAGESKSGTRTRRR